MDETHPVWTWRSAVRVGSHGRWRVHAETSIYDLDLDAGTLVRRPGQSAYPGALTPVASLVGDGELKGLLALVAGSLGQPLVALVLDHACGRVLWRVSTEITAIQRLVSTTKGPPVTEEDRAEPVFLPMVCTCSPEGRVAAQERMRSVLHRIGAGSEHLRPRSVTAERFLSEVAMSLWVDLHTHLTGLLVDQWFLITAEQFLGSDQERRIVVQDDAAEDGLAAIWEFLAEEAPLQPSSV